MVDRGQEGIYWRESLCPRGLQPVTDLAQEVFPGLGGTLGSPTGRIQKHKPHHGTPRDPAVATFGSRPWILTRTNICL